MDQQQKTTAGSQRRSIENDTAGLEKPFVKKVETSGSQSEPIYRLALHSHHGADLTNHKILLVTCYRLYAL